MNYQIPDDLAAIHAGCSRFSRGTAQQQTVDGIVMGLIERIARLEAEVKRLREPLPIIETFISEELNNRKCSIYFDGEPSMEYVTQAREALAAVNSLINPPEASHE